MRYIKPNHSTRTPTNIIVVDTETRPISNRSNDKSKTHELFLGCLSHMRYDAGIMRSKSDHMFRTKKQFWKFVDQFHTEKHPVVIYSHNAGFDATILGFWELVRSGEISLKFAVTESPPTILVGHYKCAVLRWYDTLNWFRCSLDELGKSYGIDKLPMPSDYESIVEWTSYCFRDVEIATKAITSVYDFIRENDLGVMRPTVGSQSLQTYRHKFMGRQPIFRVNISEEGDETVENDVVSIVIPHTNQEAIEIERAAYCHADRWMYQHGKICMSDDTSDKRTKTVDYCGTGVPANSIFRLDVNSLFPFAMYLNKFPCRYYDKSDKCTVSDIVRMSKNYGVIAECQIDCDTESYPIKMKGMRIQATGRYWTTLAGPELLSAISKGHVRCIGRSVFYIMEDLFTRYIRFFNNKRKEYSANGNSQFAKLCKHMMTNLYGKFAQMSGKWTNVKDMDCAVDWCEFHTIDVDTGKMATYRAMNGLVQQYRRDEMADHTFFAIPAYVTSHARMIMKRYINICGEENVYYTYIDSIHCNRAGYDRLNAAGLVHPTDIGKLKIEDISDTAEYRNIGDYSFGHSDKISGLSKNARKLSDSEYSVTEFERLDSVIQRGGESVIIISDIVKTVDRRVTCGTVDGNGRCKRLHLQRPIREDYHILESQDSPDFS